jgi:hypothetical protein
VDNGFFEIDSRIMDRYKKGVGMHKFYKLSGVKIPPKVILQMSMD